MDVIKVADAALRRSPSILSFLAPAVSRQRQTIFRTQAHRRAFTVSTARQTDENSAASSQSNAADNATASTDFDNLLNKALDQDKGVPTSSSQRTSRFSSPSAQAANRPAPTPSPAATATAPPRDDAPAPPVSTPHLSAEGNSFDDLWKQFSSSLSPNSKSKSTSTRPSSRGLDIFGSTDPNNNLGAYKTSILRPPPPLPVRLGPTLGRTVRVDAAGDVARAFRTLDIQLSRNKVKQDVFKQRFHERPGLKRKRLKSERWRSDFREGFKGLISMVSKMRNKGW